MKKFPHHYFYVVLEESEIQTQTIEGKEYFSKLKLQVKFPKNFEYAGFEESNKKIQLNFTGDPKDYGNPPQSKNIVIDLPEGAIKVKKKLEISFEHVAGLLPKTVGESILVGV